MEPWKTVSTCTPKTVQATHLFDILGYSEHVGMSSDTEEKFIRSEVFSVGGHDWSILYYPDGFGDPIRKNDYISVFLEFLGKRAKVRASCDLRLVDKTTGLSSSVYKTDIRYFTTAGDSRFAPHTANFKKRSEIEASPYLQGDCLTIECVVTVVKKPRVTRSKSFPRIEVPPSDVAEHLSKLIEDKETFDVTFSVGDESFSAHRFVLAMRSPVFKAELFGQMRETKTVQPITIQDMQPAVFRALLHFIYADSLGDLDLQGGKNTEMIQHLLVAADRYAMERLKLVCQSILCKNLNVNTVSTTLALAEQHNFHKLKGACLEFIARSNSMDAVVATQGYQNLKSTYPYVIIEALERITTFSGKASAPPSS